MHELMILRRRGRVRQILALMIFVFKKIPGEVSENRWGVDRSVTCPKGKFLSLRVSVNRMNGNVTGALRHWTKISTGKGLFSIVFVAAQ